MKAKTIGLSKLEKPYVKIAKEYLEDKLKSQSSLNYDEWEQNLLKQVTPHDAARMRENMQIENGPRRIGDGAETLNSQEYLHKGRIRVVSLVKSRLSVTYEFKKDGIVARTTDNPRPPRFFIRKCVFDFLKQRPATLKEIIEEVQSKSQMTADAVKAFLGKQIRWESLKKDGEMYVFLKEVCEAEFIARSRAKKCAVTNEQSTD